MQVSAGCYGDEEVAVLKVVLGHRYSSRLHCTKVERFKKLSK